MTHHYISFILVSSWNLRVGFALSRSSRFFMYQHITHYYIRILLTTLTPSLFSIEGRHTSLLLTNHTLTLPLTIS